MGQVVARILPWMRIITPPNLPPQQPHAPVVLAVVAGENGFIQVPPPDNVENASPLFKSFRGLDRVPPDGA
ncbi:hypothetical protein FRC08_006067 [Ceratobasidium sp. 394]|nr:hypothetical protein FRC08_006067 [Ceratobasidium sp. 394]KAG9087071.1 hypothetical protein FS749_003192 [Ceratobasidium sp. UAMH 11750]